MKHLALLVISLVTLLTCTSCCSWFGKKVGLSSCKSCGPKRYIEKQVTEYVEEQVIVEVPTASIKGAKSGFTTETITVRRPVVKTIREEIPCSCGSKFDPTPDCCGIVPKSVLSRATTQGGTGEPHVGNIPTMKVLVSGARENNEL